MTKTYAKAAKTVEGEVLPALKRAQTYFATEAPRVLGEFEIRVGRLVTPVYDCLARASPQHAHELPKSTFDRAFLLLVAAVLSYYCFRIGFMLLRIGLGASRTTFRVLFAAPCGVVLKILGITVWFATGFYCCGLCASRRHAKVTAPTDASKIKSNGAKDEGAAKVVAASPKKASLAEVSSMLEASKKKGKLDSAVNKLVGMAGTTKTMEGKSYPAEVRGKQLEKDVLKKALAKFKEVDLKKLSL